MTKQIIRLAALGTIALSSASCLSILDNSEVAVNISGLIGEYNVPQGSSTFASQCTTIAATDYLDADFDRLKNARIYDVQVSTIGTFGGTLSNGAVTVNGQNLLTFAGSWNAYNVPQSILTSNLIQVQQTGLNTLVNAVNNRTNVQICASGAVNQPFTTGLKVRVQVFGQVDAEV